MTSNRIGIVNSFFGALMSVWFGLVAQPLRDDFARLLVAVGLVVLIVVAAALTLDERLPGGMRLVSGVLCVIFGVFIAPLLVGSERSISAGGAWLVPFLVLGWFVCSILVRVNWSRLLTTDLWEYFRR